MALFVNQNSNRSKLQERLAAELTEKAKKKADLEAKAAPDGVEDSYYMKDTKQTTGLAGVWIGVIIVALGLVVAYIAVAA